jgi:hypothetical protein
MCEHPALKNDTVLTNKKQQLPDCVKGKRQQQISEFFECDCKKSSKRDAAVAGARPGHAECCEDHGDCDDSA